MIAFLKALRELWKVLESLGCSPVLCPIPGNHDLGLRARDASGLIPTTLKHWWSDEEMRRNFWNKPEFGTPSGSENDFPEL